MLTLKNFYDKIMKSQLIDIIKRGNVDNALNDPDCLEIILKDTELTEALKYRIDVLNGERNA